MKKLAWLVCLLMVFSMVACADNDNNMGDNNDENIVDKAEDEGEDLVDDVEDTIDDAGDNGNVNTDTNGEEETLTGTAQGYGGEVKVTVKVNGDDITSVEAVGEKETQGVGSNAIDQLPDKIEDADSTDVEGVSGATVTSDAIKEAVNKALDTRK